MTPNLGMAGIEMSGLTIQTLGDQGEGSLTQEDSVPRNSFLFIFPLRFKKHHVEDMKVH